MTCTHSIGMCNENRMYNGHITTAEDGIYTSEYRISCYVLTFQDAAVKHNVSGLVNRDLHMLFLFWSQLRDSQ